LYVRYRVEYPRPRAVYRKVLPQSLLARQLCDKALFLKLQLLDTLILELLQHVFDAELLPLPNVHTRRHQEACDESDNRALPRHHRQANVRCTRGFHGSPPEHDELALIKQHLRGTEQQAIERRDTQHPTQHRHNTLSETEQPRTPFSIQTLA
jgi:hypothetical protein